jgi:hypothetical protein
MYPFENLRERLLRAGIPPRHARRYVVELREHLADLEEQARATGLDAEAARQQARARLGTDAELAQAMLDKSPRSLAARAPWLVLALLPVLLLVCAMGVTGRSMLLLLAPLQGLAPADMPAGHAGLIAAASLFSSYLIGPLLMAGCIVASLRQRLPSRWIWVGFVLIALLSGVFGFHMNLITSADGQVSGPRFSMVGIVYEQGRISPVATVAIAAVRAATLFAVAAISYQLLRRRYIAAPAPGEP